MLAAGTDGSLTPIERAIATAGSNRHDFEDELARLERMVPALLRPGGHRRGEVILSQDEAWELMATTGSQLGRSPGSTCGCPALSRRRPTPSLRVFADASSASVVGANQLADVRWSALFDDVELTAADVARLAKEARPLVRSGGRWVAVDQADLQGRRRSARRAGRRHADVGRRDAAPSRSASRARRSRAASPSTAAAGPPICWPRRPSLSAARGRRARGFVGELRSYQAEALAWLGFLDSAGLGGCLALDMGLGKTPTMLAHLLAAASTDADADGPALVIAPPGGRRQLGGRGRAVHPRPPRRRAPRHRPRRRPTRSPPRSPTPTS